MSTSQVALSQLSSKICPLFSNPNSIVLAHLDESSHFPAELPDFSGAHPLGCCLEYPENKGTQNNTNGSHRTWHSGWDHWLRSKRPGFEPQLFRSLAVNLSCLTGKTRTKNNSYFYCDDPVSKSVKNRAWYRVSIQSELAISSLMETPPMITYSLRQCFSHHVFGGLGLLYQCKFFGSLWEGRSMDTQKISQGLLLFQNLY